MSKKITICYARLSRGDANPGESGSIKNQREILQDYAEKNNLLPTRHISDDDESGTGWERPGWQELMAEVDAGNVGTIILKTLDRMGRDYLRVGLYLEKFKGLDIRVIAIGDNVDTDKGEDDFVPLRNLFAEWYARDCSKKIRTVFKSRMSNGKRCSGAIPYGYLRKDGDVNDLIIDEEAAAVVRRIFQMIIDGKGVNAIATTLMNEEVPIPSEHLKRLGVPSRSRKYTNPYGWTPTAVATILKNPAYKGTLVLGKTKNTSYKGKKAVETSPDEQYIFEDAMPVIVDAETWENAQRLKRTVRRTPSADMEPNPLTGLLYCAQCGAKMSHRRSKNSQGYRENAYVCSRNRKGVVKCCSLHYIASKAVEKLVLEAIRCTAGYVRENEGEFVEKLREASELQAEKDVKENRKLLAKSQRRVEDLNMLITKLYEDNASGKVPDKHYDRMFAQYDAEQTSQENKITELQAQIDGYLSDSTRADKFIELVQKYTRFDEWTTPMLNSFIDRIDVHEAEKIDGIRTQKIEINLNYIGRFDVPKDYDWRSPEERAAIDAERERLDKKNAYERERREKKKRLAERTPEQIAADEAEKYQRRLEYNRPYSRARYYRKRDEAKAAKESEAAIA
jgi:DNA invertase Pin-like site-specific DNA recombinase